MWLLEERSTLPSPFHMAWGFETPPQHHHLFAPNIPGISLLFPKKEEKKRSPWQYSVWRRKSDGDVRNFPDISGRKKRERRTSKKRDGGRWLAGIFFSPLDFSRFILLFLKAKAIVLIFGQTNAATLGPFFVAMCSKYTFLSLVSLCFIFIFSEDFGFPPRQINDKLAARLGDREKKLSKTANFGFCCLLLLPLSVSAHLFPLKRENYFYYKSRLNLSSDAFFFWVIACRLL